MPTQRPETSSDTDGRCEHPAREHLPAYATEIALGGSPESGSYAGLLAHLAECAECQVDLDDLLEVLLPAYAERIAPAASYPRPDLTFLEAPAQPARAPDRHWLFEAGRLVIQFSENLLATLGQPALAGAARGRLLYRYVQEPGSVADLDVSIEVYAEDAARIHARVRVGVDVPSRGPLDQTGSLVALRADDVSLQGETDESGCVDFGPIPLAALPRLRIEITPLAG